MRSAASTRRTSSKLRNPMLFAEPARVDRCGLFGKYPGAYATDFDLGPKACGTS
jgi:hypothetical protein